MTAPTTPVHGVPAPPPPPVEAAVDSHAKVTLLLLMRRLGGASPLSRIHALWHAEGATNLALRLQAVDGAVRDALIATTVANGETTVSLTPFAVSLFMP